jgi:dienelactone hydrolase
MLWVLPMFALPRPTGDHPVGTTGPVSWVDTSRSLNGDTTATGPRRELVVQIWYPAATGSRWGDQARYARRKELSLVHSYLAAIRTNSVLNAPIADRGAPYPVLLFGHRWAGSRTQNTFLAEDLASHGYVVVAVDHPLNAARVQLADGSVGRSDRADALGNLEATTAPAILSIWGKELGIWLADDEFVLDRLQSGNEGQFSGHLDMNNVGAFGHSFGGASSTNLLGLDPRVKAAVNLDGWTFQGLDHRTTEPLLIVYEGTAAVPHPETGVEGTLDTTDNAAVNGSLKEYGGYRAYAAGALHLDFTDQTLFSPLRSLTFTGPIQGERIREITRGLVLGFFNQTLKGKGEISTYPEVKMEHWPGN